MFRKALTKMFDSQEDEAADAIFYETSMHLKRTRMRASLNIGRRNGAHLLQGWNLF